LTRTRHLQKLGRKTGPLDPNFGVMFDLSQGCCLGFESFGKIVYLKKKKENLAERRKVSSERLLFVWTPWG
jgi:hypothetical protein